MKGGAAGGGEGRAFNVQRGGAMCHETRLR
jgi:hypothetical protein